MSELSILICTINDRIASVAEMLLPCRDDVRYVVSWQYTDESFLELLPPALAERDDVCVTTLPGVGLSNNRNNALQHCDTPLAIIADDDVRYTDADFDRIIAAFADNPDADVLCFQAFAPDSSPLHAYAEAPFDYADAPKGTYFISFEIAFRTAAPLTTFDPRFGLGSEYLAAGEEEVFLYESYHLGARVRYVPVRCCTTLNTETTGTRLLVDARVRRSKGAVHYIMHGYLGAVLRMLRESLLWPVGWRKRLSMLHDCHDGIRYIAGKKF